MQRWALLLSAYLYNLEYHSITAHANADGLSRLPLSQEFDGKLGKSSSESSIYNICQVEYLPRHSSSGKVLQKLTQYYTRYYIIPNMVGLPIRRLMYPMGIQGGYSQEIVFSLFAGASLSTPGNSSHEGHCEELRVVART